MDDTTALSELLVPYPAELMTAYEVSRIVNSAANDVPECIAPIGRLLVGIRLSELGPALPAWDRRGDKAVQQRTAPTILDNRGSGCARCPSRRCSRFPCSRW